MIAETDGTYAAVKTRRGCQTGLNLNFWVAVIRPMRNPLRSTSRLARNSFWLPAKRRSCLNAFLSVYSTE